MKVSIVTITFNAARTLQRTLDSVACQTYADICQTYADIEHLIIDGASKDDTLAIALQYQEQSRHQVVIQSEPDRGLYDAMNKGLQKATGDYLVFLNAGDTPWSLRRYEQRFAEGYWRLSGLPQCWRFALCTRYRRNGSPMRFKAPSPFGEGGGRGSRRDLRRYRHH